MILMLSTLSNDKILSRWNEILAKRFAPKLSKKAPPYKPKPKAYSPSKEELVFELLKEIHNELFIKVRPGKNPDHSFFIGKIHISWKLLSKYFGED